MRYSLIREMDISNGEGIGISLFVQGCHFHCPGCFNQETWDFNGGKEWTPEIEKVFIKLAGRTYVDRISFLGGEPLADENVVSVLNIICKLKALYPLKKIWVYTGYKWEDICKHRPPDEEHIQKKLICIIRKAVLECADVLVDGQFQLSRQDLHNNEILWAGSTNQRIINAPQSIIGNKTVLYES